MIIHAIYHVLKNAFRLTEQISPFLARLLLRCTPSVQREWCRAATKLIQPVDSTCLHGDMSLPARATLAAAC
jgi:hypothetical protein